MGALTGQTALITGGSRGIGRAIALRLADEGADIVLNYLGNEAAADGTVLACQKRGVKALCVKADVSDPNAAKQLVQVAMEFTGRIDILVSNAGITRDQLMLRMKEADFDAVLQTNLYGSFYCMKEVIRPMLKARYGRIISMSSIVALHGNAGQANYAAAKAGLIGMTKSLAKELAAKGITVNAVAPGMIETDMTNAMSEDAHKKMEAAIPMGRMGAPEDVANAVAFLASPSSDYLTGQVLAVDGGMTC